MARKKTSWKSYVIRDIIVCIVLLTGLIINKRFDLFGYGSDSYISLIRQTVFTFLLLLIWDLILWRKRTKKTGE